MKLAHPRTELVEPDTAGRVICKPHRAVHEILELVVSRLEPDLGGVPAFFGSGHVEGLVAPAGERADRFTAIMLKPLQLPTDTGKPPH